MNRRVGEIEMHFLLLVVAWFILLALAWPLAILVLALMPLIWLISLPFRLVGICVGAAFAFVRSLLFLPARLLGHRRPGITN